MLNKIKINFVALTKSNRKMDSSLSQAVQALLERKNALKNEYQSRLNEIDSAISLLSNDGPYLDTEKKSKKSDDSQIKSESAPRVERRGRPRKDATTSTPAKAVVKTTAPVVTEGKKGRGRPKKDASVAAPVKSVVKPSAPVVTEGKKGRGRPKKDASATAPAKTVAKPYAPVVTEGKKGRGRPKKDASAAAPVKAAVKPFVPVATEGKKGRGRPKKDSSNTSTIAKVEKVVITEEKKGRGRPKKKDSITENTSLTNDIYKNLLSVAKTMGSKERLLEIIKINKRIDETNLLNTYTSLFADKTEDLVRVKTNLIAILNFLMEEKSISISKDANNIKNYSLA